MTDSQAKHEDRANPWTVAAFLWGLAEATVFFVVPDVWLSIVAQRRGLAAGLRAAAFAVLGACLGGALVYLLARQNAGPLLAFYARLPAIPPEMVQGVRAALERDGPIALFVGGFSGVPYKVFAAVAPSGGIGLMPFLAASIAARALRFLLTVVAAAVLDSLAAPIAARRVRLAILLVFWTGFYAWFWTR